MPLGDQAQTLLVAALRDPLVVARYRAKMVEVPGSTCRWWRGAVSGRGHGRFHVGILPTALPSTADDPSPAGRDLCMIAHRFGYALVDGAAVLDEVPVLGHRCDNPLVRREALDDRVEVRGLHRRPVAAGRLKLGAA